MESIGSAYANVNAHFDDFLVYHIIQRTCVDQYDCFRQESRQNGSVSESPSSERGRERR